MRYTTYGPVRGLGPVRGSREEAERDLERDAAGCRSQGGYSDRSIYLVGPDGYLTTDDGDSVYPVHGRSSGALQI